MQNDIRKRILLITCIILLVSFLSLTLFDHSPSINPSTVHAASKIKLNKTSITLRYTKHTTLKLKGTSNKVKWSSSKKTVAKVTSKGKVTATGHGTATIKAKVKVGKKSKTFKCKVTVPYTFANDNLRAEHFQKHGIEMGFQNAADYEKAAERVIVNKEALHKKEAEDGDDVYYLEKTNELVIVSVYGFIRTYFCPNDGRAYYDRT